ncbi:MAG TPA: hypothetical protein VG324_12910 [Blastocatellia bacterium]|nr:hypothetical protein [Blastocatellia bacterium]
MEQGTFEKLEWYAVFRPKGQVSIGQAVELVTEGITFARSLEVRKLLVDITNLAGFEPPGVDLRYFLIHEWARAARGVCVALVTKPSMVDSRKIGTTLAAEIGFTADVFTTEADALSWLARVK